MTPSPAPIDVLVRQPDGKYLVAGFFDHVNGIAFSPGRPNFIRLNQDGSVDRTFRAPESTSDGSTVFSVTPIGVQPDGRILAINQGVLIRLNPDGSRDATFATSSGGKARVDPQGLIYRLDAGGQLTRWLPDGTRDNTFATAALPNTADFDVGANGQVVITTPGSIGGRRLTWLAHDGSVIPNATNEYDYSRPGATFTVLPDAGVVTCGDLGTLVPFTFAAQIYRFDATGRRMVEWNIRNDVMSVAGLLHDVLSAIGGGDASLNLSNLKSRGRIHVHDHQFMLLPDPGQASDPDFADVYPMARFRPRSPGLPVISLEPTFYLQPRSLAVARGGSAYLPVSVYGRLPLSYQWLKNGQTFRDPVNASGSIDALSVENVQPSDEADYSVRVSDGVSSATSASARLELLAPPVIKQPPRSLTVAPNQTVLLTLNVSGGGLRFRWFRNGVLISDSLPRTFISGTYSFQFNPSPTQDADTYSVTVSNGLGSVTAADVTIKVSPLAEIGRLANLSVRANVGSAEQSLVAGFVVAAGSGSTSMQAILARAVGPSLAGFGVTNVLADPQMTLRSGSTIVATNDNWDGDTSIAAAAAQVGAFSLRPETKDAALFLPRFSPGAYTIQVTGALNSTGVALAELYDAGRSDPQADARFINLSCRAQITTASDSLIAGFVVSGGAAKTVLIRAIGPTLSLLGVAGALSSVELTVVDALGVTVMQSLRRSSDSSTDYFASRVGAFALPAVTNDNAVVLTLPPGAYTAQVCGANGSSGIALIEVYEVP